MLQDLVKPSAPNGTTFGFGRRETWEEPVTYYKDSYSGYCRRKERNSSILKPLNGLGKYWAASQEDTSVAGRNTLEVTHDDGRTIKLAADDTDGDEQTGRRDELTIFPPNEEQ